MHHIFHKLPDFITFLHGSIFAIRNSMVNYCESKNYYKEKGEDTAFGQRLIFEGKTIFFMREIKVVHMKKYDFRSLVKNDFLVPYYWTSLFLANKGWSQFSRPKTGYAHASRSQMLSVVLAPMISLLIASSILKPEIVLITILFGLLWLLLNARFIYFLTRERGLLFGWQSLLFTFLDNNCMALGICCGFIGSYIGKSKVSR